MAALLVAIILVTSPGETFTARQAAEARASAEAALGWWDFDYVIVEERAITVDDPFARAYWMTPHLTLQSPTLEIYIVANHQRGMALWGGRAYGLASPMHNAVFAVARGIAPDSAAATLAHELGHTVYGLPDWRDEPGACRMADIMCYPLDAYRRHIVGCRSLDAIGRPCHRLRLPLVAR